jgi:hypothetical protein
MWEPSLALIREKDGTHTLHAVTLTPNGCYKAGPVEDGAPKGEKNSRSDLSFTLNVTSLKQQFCPQIVWPVYHVRRSFTRRGGIVVVRAFVVYDGKVKGRGETPFSVCDVPANCAPDAWPDESRRRFAH